MGHPYDVERATDLHNEWCQSLMARSGIGTTHRAAPQMRAVMLELRDSLEPRGVIAIANVLPALERGIFLDDWSLDYTPRAIPDADAFAARVYARVKEHHAPLDTLVGDVFWVLNEKLGAKSAVIADHLPPALKPLWPANQLRSQRALGPSSQPAQQEICICRQARGASDEYCGSGPQMPVPALGTLSDDNPLATHLDQT